MYWLPHNLWVPPRVVVVAPIRADIISGVAVPQAILTAMGGGSSLLPADQDPSSVTVVRGFENTVDRFGLDVPLSSQLGLTLDDIDIRKELRRWARGRTASKAIADVHVAEWLDRIAFRSFEEVVESGELDHIYRRVQHECIVLREVVGIHPQNIAVPLR